MAALELEFLVEPYLQGVRIDRFLARHLRNYTRFRLMRLVVAGCVSVEQAVVGPGHRVQRGDRVRIRLVEPPDKLLPAEPMPLHVVFEDPWLVAVDKPAGLIVHHVGEKQTGTLENALQAHVDRLSPCRGVLRPGLVHRLDRWTSGVIVVAKEHLSHRRLSIAFQQRLPAKRYLALVEGVLQSDRDEIDVPIGFRPGYESVLVSTSAEARKPRRAVTRFSVVARYPRHTLVLAEPLTGRLHQIRIHLAHLGHPVVNDEFYGPGETIKPSRFDTPLESLPECDALTGLPYRRHALHAFELRFEHPITTAPMTIRAALPADLRAAVDRAESA